MVRAKVTAIRLGQSDVEPEEEARDREELQRYIALAEGYTRNRSRRLYLTYGVSGSGKSRLAAILRDHVALIHIRSDLERKRLFGLPADTRTGSARDAGIYTKQASDRTYRRLGELAGAILDAGYSPLVDATFLKESRRRAFIALAEEKDCPCTILVPEAPEAVLRERVAEREAEGRDPSEAGLAVLEAQLAGREPLTEEESTLAVTVDTVDPPSLQEFLDRLPR
jgi:predicted kinase